MDLSQYVLVTGPDGAVSVSSEGGFSAFDATSHSVVILPDTEDVRRHYNLMEVDATITNEQSQPVLPSPDNTLISPGSEVQRNVNLVQTGAITSTATKSDELSKPANWKDANAVKALIHQWKLHESKFKSTTIKNDKVWQMIAKELSDENPFWKYTGVQCENKFKEIRKICTKTKDANFQSGAEQRKCKFYDDLEEVLGDKPIVKPLSVASSSVKRPTVSHQSSADEDDEDSPSSPAPPKKMTRVEKELSKWTALRKEEEAKKEAARDQRHKERLERQDKMVDVYRDVMNRLLDKL